MIVFKAHDTVYFASPMKRHNFLHYAKVDYTFEENADMWHINDGKGTIVMMYAPNMRIIDLLRYSDVFDGEFSKEGILKMADNIKKLAKGTNCFAKPGANALTFVIARGNRAFRAKVNGAIMELGEFESFGGDSPTIEAIYEHCKDISDIELRMRTLFDKACEIHNCQEYPIAIINTKDDTYTLLEK